MVSLLNLQKGGVYSDEARKIFTEMQNRIRAMALIHEKLYTTADLSSIEFGEYIKRITAELQNTYEGIASNISISIQAGKVYLGVDQAIPCGLIINELVSNALKYAFAGRDDTEGMLRISIRENPDSMIELTVSDNGVGLPEEVDFGDQSKTLGLKLVDLLTRQLRGSLDISRNGGTSYFIRFARKEPSDTKLLP
jgi:two-component sensor histidine kinase